LAHRVNHMILLTRPALLFVLATLPYFTMINPAASSISAELAKKCRALAIKAHPTQQPGKKSGYELGQREYFRDCVANEGNVEKK
jgi:hypothetical protein